MRKRENESLRWGITAKLSLLNVLVLGVLSAILAIVFVSFGNINTLITTMLDTNMVRVIGNARSGQELTAVFADLVTAIFYGQEEAGMENLRQLEQKITILTAQDHDPELQTALHQFTSQLSSLLNQSATNRKILDELTKLENDFIFNVETLGDILNEKLDLLKDTTDLRVKQLKQIQAMTTGYRETFLQIMTQVHEAQLQNWQTEKSPENAQKNDPIFSSLEYLLLRFQILTAADAEIKAQGETLTTLIKQYQETLVRFQQARATFQEQIKQVSETKQHVLAALKIRDEENIQMADAIRSEIQRRVQMSQQITILLSGVILAVLLLTTYFAVNMVRPIVALAQAARQIATGDVNLALEHVSVRDEIGILAAEFQKMTAYMREMAAAAAKISEGDLRQEIIPRSADDVLGNAFQRMSAYLKDMALVAAAIADGNLHVNVTPRSAQDDLMHTLQHMIAYLQEVADVAEKISNKDLQVAVTPKSPQDSLNQALQKMIVNLRLMMAENERAMAAVQQQNWLITGQAELSNVMRGEPHVATLAKNIVTYLAKYLQAHVGALYVLQLRDEVQRLKLMGSYALTVRKGGHDEFLVGEGLVGQAALERESILYTDVPGGYLPILSGIGETSPRQILITPFTHDGELKGVIELGTTHAFTESHLRFLEQVRENIGIAFHSAQARVQMQELLSATQSQAERLQQQQEELRITNTELEEQTRALRVSEEELRQQQEELYQTNNALTDQTRSLEEQQELLQQQNHALEEVRRQVEAKAQEVEIASKYKSEFLANMSHELRTPLNSLLILSNLLAENQEGNLTAKQVEFAQTIHAAGSDLLQLINEVLDLSKIEAGKMTLHIDDMRLSDLTASLTRHFQHVADEKGLRFTVELADALPATIRTDRQRIEQIVKNLLSNAFKFTASGSVSVQIARPPLGTTFMRSDLHPAATIAMTVTDTGIGIPPDKQRLIFEAFQQADGTTSRKYGGTGLGLSISRELARLLGGEIQVRSQEGRGSAFTLSVPENAPTAIDATPELPPASAPPAMMRRTFPPERTALDLHSAAESGNVILIIEDDPKFANILLDVAREKGFKGVAASDGATGLRLASQTQPVGIILDFGLPDMNGQAVLEQLKHNPATQQIPVHVITAYDLSKETAPIDVIGYLTKPVTIDSLRKVFSDLEHTVATSIKQVLIVEDNTVMRTSLIELLRSEGIALTAVGTGQEAYRLLTTASFDCMILDLGLPDMTGMDLLQSIRQHAGLKHLPIIIYTGQELTGAEEALLKRYSSSIILKTERSYERLTEEMAGFLHLLEQETPEKQPAQETALSAVNEERQGQQNTILVVDDDMRNVYALTSVLERKGWHVFMAESGQEALDILAEHPDVSVVLMDIMMPGLDGYDAMRAIRAQAQFQNLPIIALTAKAMKEDRQKCLDAGANEYLSKPVDIEQLFAALRTLIP